jgi:hypothetical protein
MSTRTLVATTLSLLLVPTALASTARAQDGFADPASDRSLRVGAYLVLGFGGDADLHSDPGGKTSDQLDVSVGFGARADLPVHDFIAIGGLFEAVSFETDAPSAEREWAFDFDGYVRLRYAIELASDLVLEPYLLLPLGFTAAALDDPDGSGDEAWPGWNTGALAGLAILTASHFGGFVELGWRHHEVYTEVSSILGNVDLSLVTNQFAMHLGGLFVFD